MHCIFTKAKACIEYQYYLKSLRKVAMKYGVSKSSLSRWLHEKGVKRKSTRNHSNRLKKFDAFLKQYISKNPFARLEDVQNILEKEFQLKRSISSVFRDLKRNKITRKRVTLKSHVPERTSGLDLTYLKQALVTRGTLSIDEACFYVSETPRFGYASKGMRIRRLQNPYRNKRRSVSLLLAISEEGIVQYQISENPFNSSSFSAFINRLSSPPGTKIVLDNVQFHKSKDARKAYDSKGFVPCFIPPYSPQYNPIEIAFSALKNEVRLRNSSQELSFENIVRVLSDALENNIRKSYVTLFKHCANECQTQKASN